jgi:hypothetical protein
VEWSAATDLSGGGGARWGSERGAAAHLHGRRWSVAGMCEGGGGGDQRGCGEVRAAGCGGLYV